MIHGYGPIAQALLGTGFTWLMTALGALFVFLLPVDMHRKSERTLLDISLGFAGGVMLAASYWSLLEPALDFAEELQWGDHKWVPVALGFLAGGAFVMVADALLPDDDIAAALTSDAPADGASAGVGKGSVLVLGDASEDAVDEDAAEGDAVDRDATEPALRQRRGTRQAGADDATAEVSPKKSTALVNPATAAVTAQTRRSWRRLALLVIAITAHNIPEGMAVGVGFGAAHTVSAADATSPAATTAAFDTALAAARALAVGVGLQNLPEGLAVALPLRRLGYPAWKCFFWGQLSGACEIVAGLLGALLVQVVRSTLPFAMAFAAGAMVVCVCDQLLPEVAEGSEDGDAEPEEDKMNKRATQSRLCVALGRVSRVRLCTVGLMVGFTLMMVMDVAL